MVWSELETVRNSQLLIAQIVNNCAGYCRCASYSSDSYSSLLSLCCKISRVVSRVSGICGSYA
jgi:hypothetical protein